MALQKTFEHSLGTVENAYHKIQKIEVSKRGGIVIEVDTYASEAEASDRNNLLHAEGYPVPYELSNDNALSQGYQILKSLPEYAGATDV